MSLEEILKTTSRNFCHSSLAAQFATLVLGKADQSGKVDIVNAGHTPVLFSDGKGVQLIESAGVPLGLFCTTDFEVANLQVNPGSRLLLYSDGITESEDDAQNEYGLGRIVEDLRDNSNLLPQEITEVILKKVARFTGHAALSDDRTILVLAR